MHVASALEVPLIALFGSTSDQTTGPYNGGRVIHKHVPCSPCYRRECPIDFRCMTRIEVGEVYQEIQNLINEFTVLWVIMQSQDSLVFELQQLHYILAN